MKNAKLSVISFNDNDVIATSGPLSLILSNYGNGIQNDMKIFFNGAEYGSSNFAALQSAINTKTGTDSNDLVIYRNDGNGYYLGNNLYYAFEHDSTEEGIFKTEIEQDIYSQNGTYTWKKITVDFNVIDAFVLTN